MRRLHLIILAILFFLCNTTLQAQNKNAASNDSIASFSAHVQDAETGMELSYANVYVPDGIGTLTNDDGDFTVRAHATTMLEISYVGYEKVKIRASELPKVVKMKPLTRSLNEVVVISVENIVRQVERKLTSEYNKNAKKKSGVFFYRQHTTTRNSELAEAFIEAKNAVNLRELNVISGRHGRQTSSGMSRPLIADMNFHHPLELGPMTEDVEYWQFLMRPFYSDGVLHSRWTERVTDAAVADRKRTKAGFKSAFDFTLETLEGDTKIYAITFEPKERYKDNACMTGTIYVNANSLELMSFDGKVQGLDVEVAKDFVKMVTPIDLELHVKYRHTKGYTEVENISYTMTSGDLTSTALLLNVDDLSISKDKAKKKTKMKENMLASLNDKEFDQVLAQNADIVKRTSEEKATADRGDNDIRLYAHYNVRSNGEQKEWSINLPDNKLGNMTDRLAKIGQVLPQEKVYIHTDNTNYYIGDSIWFSAYLRRTSDDQISNISGVLYVELYNHDGYLMERKLIDTKNGYGNGAFYLNPEWYSGYYEIRAYTRWQLNWGAFERKHAEIAKYWFISKSMESRYFRDYDKLYSRVFPVYDQPKKPGQYTQSMTLRELSRPVPESRDKTSLELKLYPEGGELIEGVPCQVAFEAAYTDGRICDGEISIDNGKNIPATKAATQNRGRGVFEYTPTRDSERTVVFTSKSGDVAKAKLPKAEADGVALHIARHDSVWSIAASIAGTAQADTLGMTVMHEGRVRYFWTLSSDTLNHFIIPNTDLECGVNQATVFDTNGRIYADRLFFVTRPELSTPSLTFTEHKDIYNPYEQITLDVSMNDQPTKTASLATGGKTAGFVSLAVCDRDECDNLFDNASMQAEMLLSSEIKGFVPSPDWYFEKDDDEHRNALDLLMLTQGWRRFNWRQMAVRGEWDLTQPDERTPIIIGELHQYWPGFFYHPKDRIPVSTEDERFLENAAESSAEGTAHRMRTKDYLDEEAEIERVKTPKAYANTIKVHAELVDWNTMDTHVVETMAKNGKFRITLPKQVGKSFLFIAASDTAKWKKGKQYDWLQKMPDEFDWRRVRSKYGEFSLRIDQPYPRYLKPYTYYQQRTNYLDDKLDGAKVLDDGTRQLGEVRVKAARKRYKSVTDSLPATMVDAYEAYNYALDAGMLSSHPLDILRAYVGDYGLNRPYVYRARPTFGEGIGIPQMPIERDYRLRKIKGADVVRRSISDYTLNLDSTSLRRNLLNDRHRYDPESDEDIITRYEWENIYGNLTKIEKYVIYTDFFPRMAGMPRYHGNLPFSYIAICPYADDSSRMMYRDRRYTLPGIAEPCEYYNPDYSQRRLDDHPADYRRTLYWNPQLQLDSQGKATIKFWNNARTSKLSISAAGMTADGKILTGQ